MPRRYKGFCETASTMMRDPVKLPRCFNGSGASCLNVLPGCVRDASTISMVLWLHSAGPCRIHILIDLGASQGTPSPTQDRPRRYKTAPRGRQSFPRPPKTPPRVTQEAPGGSEKIQARTKTAPRRSQTASRGSQTCPRPPQERPRGSKTCPGEPKSFPELPKTTPREATLYVCSINVFA